MLKGIYIDRQGIRIYFGPRGNRVASQRAAEVEVAETVLVALSDDGFIWP